MKYASTRGAAPAASFEAALLAGLAPDGGLYAPERWPSISPREIESFADKSYADVAAALIGRFVGAAFDDGRLRDMAREAYGRFAAPAVAPVVALDGEDYMLELFHGPTLAFKDVAMQILARMFDDALARRDKQLTILAATSGDTGAAAIEAFKTSSRVDVFVLHPEGRVTEVQRRMMTAANAPNAHNIAVAGSFDDCQAIVKRLFADAAFAERASLGGVNSINWARLAAQTVYYFSAYAAIADAGERISFVVPTGNFGDVFAGYAAKRMGLPIARLGVATNANDILHRAVAAGEYAPGPVTPTASPSMDIQVASNFERLLFEIGGRDAAALRARMEAFAQGASIVLTARERKAIAKDFVSYAASEEDTLNEIRAHYQNAGTLIDPHTAVGRAAAKALRGQGALSGKVVTLSTAHAAKFPDAVEQAVGAAPALPHAHADLFEREERMERSPNDAGAVKTLILDRISSAGRS